MKSLHVRVLPRRSFIRHVWGGRGKQLRGYAFDDELKVQGVWKPRLFEQLVTAAQSTLVDLTC